MQDAFWLRLDNAAKIYPAIRSRELTSVFRLSVQLKQKINNAALQKTIRDIENRFPYYKVRLKPGFFWYYLEHRDMPIVLEQDHGMPCRSFNKKELMFRVLMAEKSISVEFSHILTDATGALEFLKTLLVVYFSYTGIRCSKHYPFLRPSDVPHEEEYEDAYGRYFQKTVSQRMPFHSAFHLPFSLNRSPRLNIVKMEMPADRILEKARSYGASITEYLVSIYLFSLQEIYESLPAIRKRTSNKICRIEVPVNLRKMFTSGSMRNFSLYVMPEIDFRLGHYSFEEIIKTVFHLMKLETDQKLINKILTRNVLGERNPLVRRIPLFIKAFLFSKVYLFGTSRYSGVVTNLGKISFPEEINALVDQVVFIPPPPSKLLKVNCGVAGFDNKLILSFANISTSDALERQFLRFLSREGIEVSTENYNDRTNRLEAIENNILFSSGSMASKRKRDSFLRHPLSILKKVFHT